MNTIDWLLDSDPAIRWQVMRDLTDAPPAAIAAERARIPVESVGEPSRWITVRVLRWYGATPRAHARMDAADVRVP
jgi:hypothetical protein